MYAGKYFASLHHHAEVLDEAIYSSLMAKSADAALHRTKLISETFNVTQMAATQPFFAQSVWYSGKRNGACGLN